ncbi:MAG: FAD-dependent oxidoreductase, partial [Nonomuraea sp.]|nr:FAD-dependent oxidoreductase [Nonomuraea sp.]
MIRDDVRPLVVARCRTASDVVAALGQARGRGLPVAVRSGGHDFAGRSTTTGLLVDLGDLTGVRLADGLVRVGAGTRLAELYGSLEPLGLTLPAGSGPTVGIGGLTLGGGLGFLGRTWGLTCDRLVAAEVVLADGSVVSCDEREHADLFWALRGGGAAGVGVVTELLFAPVPAPRRIPVSLGWDFRVAAQVVDAWQRSSPDAPDGLAVSLLLSVPAEPYGEPRVTLVGEPSGLSEAETADLVGDLVTRVGVGPVAPVVSHDTHPHSRSGFFRQDLPRAVLGDLVEHLAADRRPGGARELDLTPWGGAYNRIPAG